jgi:hypothetical protein
MLSWNLQIWTAEQDVRTLLHGMKASARLVQIPIFLDS